MDIGSTITIYNIIWQKLSILFGKAQVAAVGLEFGRIGGVEGGDGDVDVVFGGGVGRDGDGLAETPGVVKPGGFGLAGEAGEEIGGGGQNQDDQEGDEGEDGLAFGAVGEFHGFFLTISVIFGSICLRKAGTDGESCS